MKIFFILLVMLIPISIQSETTVGIFYKQREPSLKVLEKVNEVLKDYESRYDIIYYDIEDEKNLAIINDLGLPSTHFPFAVVIDGKYTANIDEKIISFVHFPLFMEGIGRHEGEWSLDDVKAVLEDNSLLHTENILPVLDKAKQTTSCEH